MTDVFSKDGTRIGYDKSGHGAPVILVSGGSVDRYSNAALAALLAEHFTVYNYDRRGRGISDDTAPYAIAREIEDIAAVNDAAGGSAFLFGSSSGGALALEAAASGLPVRKLAVWEAPYIVGDTRPRPPGDTAKTFSDLVASGQRGDAVEHFMVKIVGLPPEFAAYARTEPWWAAQEALAHTLAYDATVMGDYTVPAARLAQIKTPTLILVGGVGMEWMIDTAAALVRAIPGAQLRHLEGQGHNVAPEVLAPALIEFFNA
jgi:pimeloyl-ACP methyl ester carboxylesterase